MKKTKSHKRFENTPTNPWKWRIPSVWLQMLLAAKELPGEPKLQMLNKVSMQRLHFLVLNFKK